MSGQIFPLKSVKEISGKIFECHGFMLLAVRWHILPYLVHSVQTQTRCYFDMQLETLCSFFLSFSFVSFSLSLSLNISLFLSFFLIFKCAYLYDTFYIFTFFYLFSPFFTVTYFSNYLFALFFSFFLCVFVYFIHLFVSLFGMAVMQCMLTTIR